MKFLPWKRRADEAQQDTEWAKIQYRHVVGNRGEVQQLTASLNYQRDTNGWTELVGSIFGGFPQHDHH